MADTKISALSAAASLTGAEFAGIQSGANYRFSKALFDAVYAAISHTHAQSDITNLVTDLAGKQATLVSGTNIKTVGGFSLLGAGELVTGTPSGTKYLRDDLSWQTVTATAPELNLDDLTPSLDQTVTANYAAYIPGYYEIFSGTFLELGNGAIFEIG